MKRIVAVAALLLALILPSQVLAEFAGRPLTNNVMAPTGYTLGKGEFTVGLGSVAFGFTDNIQAGTNLLLFAFQIYNADIKASFMKGEDLAFAAGVSVLSFSFKVYDDDVLGDDEVGFTAIAPYGALSKRMGENTVAHVSTTIAIFSSEDDADIQDADFSGATQGTSFTAGLEHGYSERTRFLAEIGYDSTFEGLRVGGAVLFGWTKFRLKLGLNYFGAGDGFTWPVIGVWWRFQG